MSLPSSRIILLHPQRTRPEIWFPKPCHPLPRIINGMARIVISKHWSHLIQMGRWSSICLRGAPVHLIEKVSSFNCTTSPPCTSSSRRTRSRRRTWRLWLRRAARRCRRGTGRRRASIEILKTSSHKLNESMQAFSRGNSESSKPETPCKKRERSWKLKWLNWKPWKLRRGVFGEMRFRRLVEWSEMGGDELGRFW